MQGSGVPCHGSPGFWLNVSISESSAPGCEERAHLLRLCALAESHHRRAIQELARFIGKLNESDYKELLEFADTASEIVAEAREALDRHTAGHGC
jgi:hypothetical protein